MEMFQNKKTKFKKGQSLFEIIVAISVVSIGMLAVVGLIRTSVSDSDLSKNQNLANRYTQEALEWLRDQRDTNWTTFVSFGSDSGTVYCLNNLNFDNANACGSSEFISGTIFIRELNFVYDLTNPNKTTLEVVTKWNDQSGEHDARSTLVLTNWKGN